MLNPNQFADGRLFNPGPPVPKPSTVDHAKEAMEFATRPDIVWHSSHSPFMRPDEGRQFHAGTSRAAYERARDHGLGNNNPGKAIVHPVVLTGDFQLPSSHVEAGMLNETEPLGRVGHVTRWSDSVVNNYSVLTSEAKHHGEAAALQARTNAEEHLNEGRILPYMNRTEHKGSTSFVATDPTKVRFFNDTVESKGFHQDPRHRDSDNQILTGKFLGRHGTDYDEEAPNINLGTVEYHHLPFDDRDVQRLGLQTVFHNNVPGIHRQVAALTSHFFDTPLGLHPSSPLAKVPEVETEQERYDREADQQRSQAPNIMLGLNTVKSNPGSGRLSWNVNLLDRMKGSSMPYVDHLY